MDIGARLRKVRRERKMTVAALAQASHLSKGFISQVEQGHSQPSLASLQRITSSLHVSLAHIIGSPGEIPPVPDHSYLRPRTYRRAELHKQTASITLVNESAEGTAFSLSLPPGTVASGAPSPGTSGAKGVCFVLRGSTKFSQPASGFTLSEGDALTWDVTVPYSFNNTDGSDSILCLFLPALCPLPELTSPEQVAPRRETAPPAHAADAGGPLRLVAMRAHRGYERRR